jgi:hypothetical protein
MLPETARLRQARGAPAITASGVASQIIDRGQWRVKTEFLDRTFLVVSR